MSYLCALRWVTMWCRPENLHDLKRLYDLYRLLYGCEPSDVEPITGSASARRYLRMYGPAATVIGTIGTDVRENQAFLYLSDYLAGKGLPVPKVMAVSDDNMAYLQMDLGDDTLYKRVLSDGVEASMPMLRSVVGMLARFHSADMSDFDASHCYPRHSMDSRSVMWDLNYFKYCCLKPSGIEPDDDRLEDAFAEFCAKVVTADGNGIILRDFQSRNVMIHDGKPYVIDFQGARIGNGLYDLASLLWQSRLDLSEGVRDSLAGYYCAERGLDRSAFVRELHREALLRVLQVLGTYGFRGMIKGNAAFIEPLARSLQYLQNLIDTVDDDIPAYLAEVCHELTTTHPAMTVARTNGLTVRVMSFSYRKGIPADWSGNGGGFVFDCRALPNPGRYEQYKRMTGRDIPVIEFLENDGEIIEYLEQCYALVRRSVRVYLKRGFSSLMVCFGCTGGQHRSVYSAEWMARKLSEEFGVRIDLQHREQGINQIIEEL